MSPFFPVAQISPGVGILDGIFILLFLIVLLIAILVSTVGCGVQTWSLLRRGNQKRGSWFAATIVSLVVSLSFMHGFRWIVTPKSLSHVQKHWDFTRSYSLDVIGEPGE